MMWALGGVAVAFGWMGHDDVDAVVWYAYVISWATFAWWALGTGV